MHQIAKPSGGEIARLHSMIAVASSFGVALSFCPFPEAGSAKIEPTNSCNKNIC